MSRDSSVRERRLWARQHASTPPGQVNDACGATHSGIGESIHPIAEQLFVNLGTLYVVCWVFYSSFGNICVTTTGNCRAIQCCAQQGVKTHTLLTTTTFQCTQLV